VETHRATLSFNPQLCWYLDSTFCSFFHQLKQHTSPATVLMAGRLGIFGVWAFVVLIVAVQLLQIVRSQCYAHQGLRSRCRSVLTELSRWSYIGTAARLILLVAPPIFFQLIFLPCFECFDFEAAATHEVGHVLGLSHPDTLETSACCGYSAGANVYHTELAAGLRMDRSRCMLPWEGVVEGSPAGGAVRPSIMKALTQHNPSVCLSDDDLEALHVLYPDCDLSISEPVCFKFKHNIGWVRLGVYILFPVLIILLFVTLLNQCVQKHQVARLKSAKDLLGLQKRELGVARRRASLQEAQVMELEDALQQQKATEEKRIDARARRLSVQMVEQHLGQQRGGVTFAASGPDSPERTNRRTAGRSPGRAPARMGTVKAMMGWMTGRFTDRNTDCSAKDDFDERETCTDIAPEADVAAAAGAVPVHSRPIARQGTKLKVTRQGSSNFGSKLERESSVPLVDAEGEAEEEEETEDATETQESSSSAHLPALDDDDDEASRKV